MPWMSPKRTIACRTKYPTCRRRNQDWTFDHRSPNSDFLASGIFACSPQQISLSCTSFPFAWKLSCSSWGIVFHLTQSFPPVSPCFLDKNFASTGIFARAQDKIFLHSCACTLPWLLNPRRFHLLFRAVTQRLSLELFKCHFPSYPESNPPCRGPGMEAFKDKMVSAFKPGDALNTNTRVWLREKRKRNPRARMDQVRQRWTLKRAKI